MTASRATVSLAVLVTALLVVSSLGLISAVAGGAGSGASISAGPHATSVPEETSRSTSPTPDATPSTANAASSSSSPLPAPPTPLDQQAAGAGASSPLASQILNSLATKGVPLHDVNLPYLLNTPDPGLTNGHVNLTYTSSPAPYGISDLGLRNVSGVITPYTLSTRSVEANFSTDYLAGYSADLSSPDEWGIQLNAVLTNVTLLGTTGYQFWTQQSLDYSPSLKALIFVSNIWNFSNRKLTLSCNFLYAAASNGHNECPEFYYGATGYIPATEPFSVQLYLNSTLVGGRDAVYFNYSLTSRLGTSSSNFNYAIFNSLATGGNPASTKTPAYEASGYGYNPVGLPDDFEVILGGPGGGSNFDVMESKYTYMSLQYYNATAGGYLTVPSAYNVGAETGETSVGVNAAWSQFRGAATPAPGITNCVDCVTLGNGPSFQYGLWNVGGAGVGGYSPPSETDWETQTAPVFILNPSNAFLFLADGYVDDGYADTNYSLFQWSPDFAPDADYSVLPIGDYTGMAVLSDHAFLMLEFSITGDSGPYSPEKFDISSPDPTVGVDTPLWAFNATGLAAVSNGTDAAGDTILDNNEYAPIGQIPATSLDASRGNMFYMPWFGLFNDYGFPVFPGILLANVAHVDVFSAPSFSVMSPGVPTYDQNVVKHFGWAETNNLQMLFWNDSVVNFESSTVAGWFPTISDLMGPLQSFASVVFWNTSSANIAYNTFEVGGMGLFLYGGVDNTIWDNTFVSGTPPAGEANPAATAAAYWGSIGLVDADWGDAESFGVSGWELCDECDVIYNNAFDTIVTATSPFLDPYTGNYPNQFQDDFSQAWNIAYTPGVTNIIGGNYLGGNYYWDYGFAENPFGHLPDIELSYLPSDEFGEAPAFICGGSCLGGDYYPLVNVVLHQVTFKEEGLPTGVGWYVEMYVPPEYNFQGYYAENATTAPHETNLSETAGPWYYYAYSDDKYYAATVPEGTVVLTGPDLVVTVVFETAYILTVKETGLPAGTDWYGETYNSAYYYHFNYSTGTETNISGQIAGTYIWWAEAVGSATGEYAIAPSEATVAIASNTTVDVTFVPVSSLDVEELGLPAGATWTWTASSSSGYNFTSWSSGDWINLSAPDVTYTWTASSPGYVATPANGTFTLSGSMTVTVSFREGAALTFSEAGLPTGTSWSVAVTQGTTVTTLVGTGTSIVFDTVVGPYSYTVSANGYAATPSSGSGTLPTDASVVAVFTLATGTLTGTVSPAGATLWVDGVKETLGSGGTYSLTLPVGVHSIEVAESGYVTYFNNATVTLGGTTTVNVVLTAVPATASGLSGISSLGWVLIALLAVLAAIFLVTTLLFSRRRRQPPPVAAYHAPGATPGGAGGPPAGALEPWQETPPSPPGSS